MVKQYFCKDPTIGKQASDYVAEIHSAIGDNTWPVSVGVKNGALFDISIDIAGMTNEQKSALIAYAKSQGLAVNSAKTAELNILGTVRTND